MQNPYFRIKINDQVFETGKNLLSCTFTLGETKRRSSCSFTIFDEQGRIGSGFINASYLRGGLDVPQSLIEEEKTAPTTASQRTATGLSDSGGTISKGGVFTPEVRAFLDMIALHEAAPGQSLTIQGYFSNNGTNGSTGFFPESESVNTFPASAGSAYNVGRYQFREQDFNHARQKDPTIKGFSPTEQDRIAYFKLGYRGALPYVLSGQIPLAIDKAAKEWASLPTLSNPRGLYNQVQAGTTIANLISYYNTRLEIYKNEATPQESTRQKPKLATSKNGDTFEYITKSTLNNTANVSFYGNPATDAFFIGRKTANGEVFDQNKFTAAHNTLPFGTLVKVTWLVNNKSVIVRINDRGAFNKLGRQLDLSFGAAQALSDETNNAIAAGVLSCRLEIVSSVTPVSKSPKDTAKSAVQDSIDKAKNISAKTPDQEVSVKGSVIYLEASLDGGQTFIETSYIHIGTLVDVVNHRTTFRGAASSWILNRRKKNSRYINLTLKGLASQIARSHNFDLNMAEEGSLIEQVSQVGSSDWEFLVSVAERQGFKVSTIGRQLHVYRVSNRFEKNAYIMTPVGVNLKGFELEDTAQTDGSGSGKKIDHQPGVISTRIDSKSGSLIKSKENKVNAGKNSNYTVGNPSPPIELEKVYSNPRPSEDIVKEFTARMTFSPTQLDLENLTPDTPLIIEGAGNFSSDKNWFIETVTYEYSGIVSANLDLYLATKPKIASKPTDSGVVPSQTLPQPGQSITGTLPVYTIRTPQGANINTYTDLNAHWAGTGGYVDYRLAPGQRGGRVSYMKRDPSLDVWDYTLYLNGSNVVPLPSPSAGTVIQVIPSVGGVKVDIGGGSSFRILHMSGIRVKVGDRILRGSILGLQNTVGGTSTGVHTHIEAPTEVVRSYIQSLKSGQW